MRPMEEDSPGHNRTGNPSEVGVREFIHRTSPRSNSMVRVGSKEVRDSAYRWLRADSRFNSQSRVSEWRMVAMTLRSRATHSNRQTNLIKPGATVKSSCHCLASIPITEKVLPDRARPAWAALFRLRDA
jgi:hypothetical protein